MRRIGWVWLALAAWVAAGADAAAQPPSRQQFGATMMFELADRDRDGRVSPAEGWAVLRGMFAGADANRDGVLNQSELERLPIGGEGDPARRQRNAQFGPMLFRIIDQNRDSRIEEAELRVAFDAFFRALDADRDDLLSRQEALEAGR